MYDEDVKKDEGEALEDDFDMIPREAKHIDDDEDLDPIIADDDEDFGGGLDYFGNTDEL